MAISSECKCEPNFTCGYCLRDAALICPAAFAEPYREPRFLNNGKRNPLWKPRVVTVDDFADLDAIAYGSMV